MCYPDEAGYFASALVSGYKLQNNLFFFKFENLILRQGHFKRKSNADFASNCAVLMH